MSEQPRAQGLLTVGDGQTIFWEEWGAPDGVSALYLHGGPGGGLRKSGYRKCFDLARTRVIGFDQRGCGSSRPHASDPAVALDTNTTQHLISDIEALREDRGVERWIINGVSWGSTLALAYAQTHPERVVALVLLAVTSTHRREVDWITEDVGAIFPEAWDRLAKHAEDAGIGYIRGQGRLVEAYARLMNSSDGQVLDAASREWALWEDTHVSIGAGAFARDPRWDDDRYRIAFARLVTHYWVHDAFLTPPLLDRMDRLRGIPGWLIHGRRDVSGPVITAWELHRRWPGSKLIIDEGDEHDGASMVEHWGEANRQLVASALGRR
ncbi:alpha/beta fold hydrolase [Leucobacter sp. wl10]|uniref:alpha/beta fold hydrolase n=1 Tax=Leucobacter sp. wl10 TaxID=2304677 RepID=UPI000E5AE972|nr:alpha/beta fold hydrolase [Leucobacter sp. wl10]RGE21911.1 alpha/beta fold hydrolase [Leucobacter sp. wl10]